MAVVEELQAALPARAFVPGDVWYEALREPFHREVVPQPPVIVKPMNAAQAAAAVAVCAKSQSQISVMRTGHGIDQLFANVIMMRTDDLREIVIDPQQRTARIGAGCTWDEVVALSTEHGLAPLCGAASGIGAVGYTLGGGLGLLGRKYGFAADSVRALDVVLADGRQATITPKSAPDLFWGLLGSKSGLAIVTSLTVDLYPVATLFGGTLSWPTTSASQVLPAFYAWSLNLPDEMSASIAMIHFPASPSLPPELRNQRLTQIRIAYLGDELEGRRLVAPLMELPGLFAEHLRMMPFTDAASIHGDPVVPGAVRDWSALLTGLDGASMWSIADLALRSDLDIIEFRRLGGQLARQPETPNCVEARGAEFTAFTSSRLGPDRVTFEAADDAIVELSQLLAPYTSPLLMANFAGSAQRADLPRAWTEQTRIHLSAIKQRWDPANLFPASFV